jgi:hypothetical protein
LQEKERVARHAALVRALEGVAVHLPEDRTGWGTSLLQQTLLVAVDRPSETSRQLYQQANHALDLFSLTSRMGADPADPIRSDEGPLPAASDSRQPTRLTIRAEPLPVQQSQSAEMWTQWPPPNEMRYASEAIAKETPVHQQASLTSSESVPETPPATVYRSGGKLQPVGQNDGVDLNAAPSLPDASIRPGLEEKKAADLRETMEIEAPLETYDDPSVMHWLGSDHRRLQQAAEAELFRRGYRAEEIDLARQLVTGDVSTRLQLIDFIAQNGALDPRSWLPMLLEDPSRDVKLRAISVLATMDDPAVAQRLQIHLSKEQDPTVAARIRRVLKLR